MKVLLVVLSAMLLLLQYRLWLSPAGVREAMQLREAVAAQRAQNEALLLRNEQLAAEVRDLKQGYVALEERARADLGLVAPGETYYQVVPRAAPVSTPAPAVTPPDLPPPQELPTRSAAR